MTLKPKDHALIKYSIHREILEAFDLLISKQHGTRTWFQRQLVQEYVADQAHLLPDDTRERVMAIIECERGV